MKILWLSDFDPRGSGYYNISVPLCNRLADRGHDVKALGMHYKGQEHNHRFSLLPVGNASEIMAMTGNLYNLWQFDVFICALDIIHQERFLQDKMFVERKFPYVGIMPLESIPLVMDWAIVLAQMNHRLIISEFGTEEVKKMGIEAEYLQIGVDKTEWYPITEEERKNARNVLGVKEDEYVVLTVADNQERKNLSAALEIFKEFAKDKPVKYVLVTREFNVVGWKLRSYAAELGIVDKFILIERGMSVEQLRLIYGASDVFLMVSKAEGLCNLPDAQVWTLNGKTPILEADEVVTHTGKVNKVIEKFTRDYSGDVYELNMSYGLDPIKLTADHLVYSAKRARKGRHPGDGRWDSIGWEKVQDLQKGDYVFYPKPKRIDIDKINVSEVLSKFSYIVQNNRVVSFRKADKVVHPNAISLPEFLPISDELLSLMGYYIAEGCDTKDGLDFSFHTEEREYQEEVSRYCKLLFNRNLTVYDKSRHRTSMRLYGTIIGRFFGELCGHSSHQKHLPSWALYLPPEKAWILLRSMFFGDGTFTIKSQSSLRYSTVSRQLAEQMQFLLFGLGIISSFRVAKNRVEYTVAIYGRELDKIKDMISNWYSVSLPTRKKNSSKAITVDDGFLLPISEIKQYQYTGKVYNLEVENDNSYLLSGGAVHNCLPLLEAMAVGIPCIATNNTGMADLLGDGRGILVDYEYTHRDPFGNGYRYWINKDQAVEKLNQVYQDGYDITRSTDYVDKLDWKIAVETIEKVMDNVTKKTTQS